MSLPVVVHKFGGASLADAPAIANVGRLLAVEGTQQRCVVVTSALEGVTNQLLAAISCAARDDAAGVADIVTTLNDRHVAVARQLELRDEQQVLDAINTSVYRLRASLAELPRDPAPLSDAVLSFGERTAALIVSAMLDAQSTSSMVVDATQLIHTDGRHGNAAPDLARTDETALPIVAPYFTAGKTVVVPGFTGAGANGRVVTLGRGGSDLTAAILARALDAREVILWKDVPGLMTADPRIVPGARVVPLLDAREASELAYYGAKVLHPRTLLPLRQGTTLRLRPFADPSASGTTIIVGRASRGAPVRAISGVTAQALVSIAGTGMLGVPGVAARVFGALAARHVSVSMISQASSEQSICFSIPAGHADEVEALLRTAFAEELERREVDEIFIQPGLSTIAVVGSGMANTPGIAARIFGAIADARVNVIAIAQGSSERNISFIVDESQAPDAVRAVHAEFRLDKVGGGRARGKAEPTDVVLLGMGRVAQEIVTQLGLLARHKGPAIRIVGMIDTSGYVFHARGMTPRQIGAILALKQSGQTLANAAGGTTGTAKAAVDFMAAHALSRPILIDVASGDTGLALAAALSHGVDLVLANKAPLAAPIAQARAILQDARASRRRVLHEATVGAGLPVIDTLQQLHASGDRVDSIDSSPSGTMGFLFSEMGRGRKFSTAVLDAMSRGYTEPDPRDDLSGLDVARKGIILARILGYTGEMTDVSLESLVPPALQGVSRDEFLAALASCDAEWEQRVADARERGEVLRYRARATRGGVRVGLVSVPTSNALASLDGTDNLFVFTTARYRERPLVISGPGAGVEVTAAGVLGDVLRLIPG